jgi:hypothetical protein
MLHPCYINWGSTLRRIFKELLHSLFSKNISFSCNKFKEYFIYLLTNVTLILVKTEKCFFLQLLYCNCVCVCKISVAVYHKSKKTKPSQCKKIISISRLFMFIATLRKINYLFILLCLA